MSKVVRSVKNVTKGYSAVEIKVRNATSNDPWGPVGTDMADIARMTFNSSADFYQIMDMLDKRLNDKGKNWRHVLKSLKVLDYCLHEGSELVVTWAKKNIYIIKTLREFQYIDEDGRDVGKNIRVAAKELTALIQDEERLRAERQDRKQWKSRVTGIDEYGPDHHAGEAARPPKQRERPHRNRRDDEEDWEYKLAIEASKNQEEEDRKRREARAGKDDEDEDLEKAIRLSKEEEELRRRELEQGNSSTLFDLDDNQTQTQPSAPQPTGFNQGYQQGTGVDWYGNLLNQQQPQSTGFLNSAYSQPTGAQGQQPGFQNGFGYSGFQQQPQQAGFGENVQPGYMQPQQTNFSANNPYGQQMNGFGELGQQQPLEPPNTLQPGSHNPWATPVTQQPQESLKPLPTGSNNPFASGFNRPQSAQAQRAPTLSTLQEQKTQTQFNNTNFNPPVSFAPQQPVAPAKPVDPHAARLNELLSTGEGQDTFGNVGNLRIPAQHTAPGVFVNSAGSGADRIAQNATGNNPFLSPQFAGIPQTTRFAQQNRMMPAQTGPATAFGSGNPFGGTPSGAPQQSGNLIEL